MRIYGKQVQGVSIFAALILAVLFCSAASAIDFYVSPLGLDTNNGSIGAPFQTIARARDVVRTVNSNMTADINVYLRGGWYTQTSTLTFTSADSGTNGYNVVYQAYPGEYPCISGGKQITGWTLYDSSKNIWKASAPGLNTRQLYIDCVRAVRAHKGSGLPGAVKTSTGYTTTDTTMQNWGNKSDIEFVYNAYQGGTGGSQWTEMRCGVSSISGTTITMKTPGWTYCTTSGIAFHQITNPTDIENAYELLDLPGEWYLDKSAGMIYYIPRAGEDLSVATVIAPVLETLVSGSGTLGSPIRNIQFKGITFAHATWLTPSGVNGFPEMQANYCWNSSWTPANVVFKTAQNLRFDHCVFKHLGAIGLELSAGAQNCTVTGCVFTDISGSSIKIGDVNDPTRSDTRSRDTGDQVSDCYIHDTPCEYHGGVGIFAGYVSNLLVNHNEIGNLPYSAISCGWGWGTNSYAQNNVISYNNIYSWEKNLADGGAIYSLSAQPNSSWHHNYGHDVSWAKNGDFRGWYTDEGTAYVDIHDSVIARIGSGGWYSAWTSSIHDNTIHDNYTDTTNIQNNGTNCVVTNTTLVTNNNWPQGALDIMNGCGLESGYSDVRTMPCACSVLGAYNLSRVSDAKSIQNGSKVVLPAAIVTGKLSDRIYMEPADRASGIAVLNASNSAYGDNISVIGRMSTLDGERVIKASTVLTALGSQTVPNPVFLSNRTQGGGVSGLQSAVIDNASNNKSALGVNNIGLLITTSGLVTYVDPSWKFFYLDDGSGIGDGSTYTGVRVDCTGLAAPLSGSLVIVTGISGATTIGGNIARVVRVRSQNDIISSGMNFLRNSGFELGSYSNWTSYGSIDSIHSGSWFGNITAHTGTYFVGNAANDGTKNGGFYQRAAVPTGSQIYAGAWSCIYRALNSTSSALNRVGIDPTGGTSSTSSNIVWSSVDTQPTDYYSEWHQLTTPTVTCSGGYATVFLDMIQRNNGGWHINCFDDAGLYYSSP